MASLYEYLCHLYLTCSDPLLEEMLAYLPTRIPPHIFDYIAYENSDHESIFSIDSSVSAFYCDDSTYFLKYFYIFLLFVCNSKFLPQRRGQDSRKKPPRTKRSSTASGRAEKLYKSMKAPELASISSCLRPSASVQARNNRSHCRR